MNKMDEQPGGVAIILHNLNKIIANPTSRPFSRSTLYFFYHSLLALHSLLRSYIEEDEEYQKDYVEIYKKMNDWYDKTAMGLDENEYLEEVFAIMFEWLSAFSNTFRNLGLLIPEALNMSDHV